MPFDFHQDLQRQVQIRVVNQWVQDNAAARAIPSPGANNTITYDDNYPSYETKCKREKAKKDELLARKSIVSCQEHAMQVKQRKGVESRAYRLAKAKVDQAKTKHQDTLRNFRDIHCGRTPEEQEAKEKLEEARDKWFHESEFCERTIQKHRRLLNWDDDHDSVEDSNKTENCDSEEDKAKDFERNMRSIYRIAKKEERALWQKKQEAEQVFRDLSAAQKTKDADQQQPKMTPQLGSGNGDTTSNKTTTKQHSSSGNRAKTSATLKPKQHPNSGRPSSHNNNGRVVEGGGCCVVM